MGLFQTSVLKKYFKTFNMKLLIILMFLTTFIQAQTIWAPSGAVWYYDYISLDGTGYTKIEYIGDTIIQAKQCKILEKTLYKYNIDYDTIHLGKEFTYSENNIVYHFNAGHFYTLYNFSATNNDTWQITNSEPIDEFCDSTAIVTVDSNDIFSFNNYNLNRLYVAFNDTNKSLLYGEIIERIGASSYMFPINNCNVDGGYGGQLRCYYDNDFGYYNTGIQDCDFIENITEPLNKKNPNNIYPSFINNSNYLTIQSNRIIDSFKIINMEGHIIIKQKINSIRYDVNIADLDNGIYIIYFNKTSHKFIINR